MIKPKPTIQKIRPYEPPLEGRRKKLRLDFNENTAGCSPKVLKALNEIDANELSIYPEYNLLKKELAEFLRVSQDEIILTNGADEGIEVAMRTYLQKGDRVVIPVPTFAMFELCAKQIGLSVIEVLYNKDLSFPEEKVLEYSKDAKAVVIVSPNNPTSTVVSEKCLKKIVELGNLVIIDEAYYEFYGKTAKKLIRKENVIVIRTFSKAFGLAGIRLGYIIANKKIIKDLRKVVAPYSVSTFAVAAGRAAIKDIDYVNKYVQEIKSNREYIKSELEKLGIKTFPAEGNFFIADFGEKCNQVEQKLREQGILVRNRTNYPLLKNCLRITVGTKEQTATFLSALKNILKEKVLLFDMDGVLVDVSQSYRVAISKTVEKFTGTKPTFEEIQKLKEEGGFNNDWDATEELIRRKGKSVSKGKIIGAFQKVYIENLIDKEKWLLDRKKLLNLYKKYRLGIVTGRPRKEAEYVLERENAAEFFEIVVGMEDVPRGKPDPSGIKLALEKMKGSAVYIGDSVDDMQAANAAGIDGIGVMPPGSSQNTKDLLKKSGAKKVLNSVNEVFK